MKQEIIHCPTKHYLPARNEGNHVGVHPINPLPPGKEWLAGWYLERKNLYVRPPAFRSSSTLPFPHILVIGMAPGESEDLHGKPFVGISGNILNTVFAYAQSTFLMTCTNTVCCRPYHNPETTPAIKLHGKNRDPEPSEMEHCKPHIAQLLLSYKFSGVLTLGELATKHMKTFDHRLPTLSLFHPAYIARLAFKLYTIRDEAKKLQKWLNQLDSHKKN